MCTTKKKKKDKKSSTPSSKRSKKPKSSKEKTKSKETAKKEEVPKGLPNEPVISPEVKAVPPPVKLDVKRMAETKTQPEPTSVVTKSVKAKSVKKKTTKSMQVETTGKMSEETQLSQTIRTEMLENAQCNPFPIDLKKMFTEGTRTIENKFADNSDIDSESTLACINSDYEGFSLAKLAYNSCPPEKKRTTTKRQKAKPAKSSPNNRSVETQRSE